MKKYYIIGGGISGTGCSNYLINKNYTTEICNIFNDEDAQKINWQGDGIYFSPGVRFRSKYCAHLPVINDIDTLYADNLDADFIAITGTSGKTTTSSLLSHIFSVNGLDNHLAGNIGKNLFEKKSKIYILELSSFQCEHLVFFTPTIGVITNLDVDHLNIHRTYPEYLSTKYKIISTKSKYSYLGENCPYVPHNSLPIIDINNEVIDNELHLSAHNKKNFQLCASIAAQYGISYEKSYEALKTYAFPIYRETLIYQDQNKKIINNSKCTNILALKSSLKQYDNITLICCGQLKSDITYFDMPNVKRILVCGPLAEEFSQKFSNVEIFQDLEEIVSNIANETGTILFSPVGASYDKFTGYKDRGKYFDSLVQKYCGELLNFNVLNDII